MLIYLLRHGDAVAGTENSRRPLSAKGRAEVERTASLALQRGFRAEAIYHSALLRALETAEILARRSAPPLGVHAHTGLLPEDDPVIVNAELQVIEHPVAFVGHLPHLRRLAALLLTGDPERSIFDFQPAMMACFEKENNRWKIVWRLPEAAN